MNLKVLLIACCLLSWTGSALAQWQTTQYKLKAGWNAIYLTGDATYGTIDTIISTAAPAGRVLEIWRWNPNPTQVQFTESPLMPSPGTPEWSVWKPNDDANNTLRQLTGQTAYLVNGSTGADFTLNIKQSPLPPRTSWVRNGANLLGFPTRTTAPGSQAPFIPAPPTSSYPTFATYFATFPAAIAANTRIYKYAGGALGAGNPVQVFSPTTEKLDRTQAYWFSAEVVGNFYAPVEIDVSNRDGLAFGRTGSMITVRVRNRTAAFITLNLSTVPSEPAPGSSSAIPAVDLTFNGSAMAISAPVTVGPQTTVELLFGINRAAMTEPFYASFLRLTDGSLFDVFLPVSATKGSLAGLWVGDVSLTNVSSRVTNTAKATATVTNGSITALSVSGTGGYGYTTAPVVTIDAPVSGTTATATATVAAGAVTGFTITNAGSGYAVASPKVTIAPPPPLAGSSTPRPFPMRTLLHVGDNGVKRLLSKVFIGQLKDAPHDVGLCTMQSLLKQDALASAQRLSTVHMPLNKDIPCSGSVEARVGTDAVLTCTIQVEYNDPTNPFMHQYHPDHDNKDARFQPVLGDGVESYTVTRTCVFTFQAAPPVGSTVTSGWGSSVIGGNYRETITGLHKQTLQLDGTFELRRASEIGKLYPE